MCIIIEQYFRQISKSKMATWTEDGTGKLTVTGATVEYTGEAKGDAKVFRSFKVKTNFYSLPLSICLSSSE